MTEPQEPELQPGPLPAILRRIATNHRIFHLFSFVYAWMNSNPTWLANSTRLLDPIDADRSINVLDLGAGPGNSSLAMGRRRINAHFIAFDLAESMVLRALKSRIRAGWTCERLAPVHGNAEKLPFAEHSLGAVTAHSFLYLLPDYRTVLAEAERVLEPGGLVAFLEPHAGQVSWSWLLMQTDIRVVISLSLWRLYSWMHRRFSAEEIQILLEEYGFISVKTEPTLGGFGLFVWGRKAG